MTILVLLPVLLPLILAITECGIARWQGIHPWLPVFRLAGLALIAVLIYLLPSLTPAAAAFAVGIPGLVAMPQIAFQYANTGTAIALAFLLTCMSAAIRNINGESAREQARRWVIIALVIAACLAANVYTLCLIWICISALMMLVDLRHPADGANQLLWQLLSNLVPIMLLLVVMVYIAAQAGQGAFSEIASVPLLTKLVMAASLIRMPVFPLPNYDRDDWFYQCASLCTGIALYLRVTYLSTISLPGAGWLIPALAASYLCSSLLAVLTTDSPKRMHYLFTSLASALVLGPIAEPITGTGLAVLYLYLIILLPVVIIHDTAECSAKQARLGHWLAGIGLAAMIGLPFTLGLAVRWHMQSLVGYNQKGTTLLLTFGHILNTLSLWMSLRETYSRHVEHSQLSTKNHPAGWMSCAVSAVTILWILLLGIYPAAMNALLPTRLSFPTSGLLSGGISAWIYPLATTLIIPLIGAFFILFQRTGININLTARSFLLSLFGFSWFYRAADGLGHWISRVVIRLTDLIETRYALGWTLIWMMIMLSILRSG